MGDEVREWCTGSLTCVRERENGGVIYSNCHRAISFSTGGSTCSDVLPSVTDVYVLEWGDRHPRTGRVDRGQFHSQGSEEQRTWGRHNVGNPYSSSFILNTDERWSGPRLQVYVRKHLRDTLESLLQVLSIPGRVLESLRPYTCVQKGRGSGEKGETIRQKWDGRTTVSYSAK